jgi:hypothetical protein
MAENGKARLQEIFNKLKDVAADLTTLEVTTLSGDITMIFDSKTENGGTKHAFKDKDALMNMMAEQSKLSAEDSKVYIVAYSRTDFDQDTVNFVKAGLSDDDRKLYQLHLESIKAAQEARSGFLKMLVGLFD